MRKARVILSIFLVLGHAAQAVPVASAMSANGVVISQMYPGADGAASQEFVELYNNADHRVDISGWCVRYVSSTGNTTKKLGCFTPPSSDSKLWIDPGGYALLASEDMKNVLSVSVDEYFNAGISADHGYIRLTDASDHDIDKLGWGVVDDLSYTTADVPDNGKSLQRRTHDFALQDTNDDHEDFMNDAEPLAHASGVYEEQTVTDLCPNLPDAFVIPAGYLRDDDGNCYKDSCVNIDGLQIDVPAGYDVDSNDGCTLHDECDNLPGAQNEMPDYAVRDGVNDCVIEYPGLRVTEVLPNAIGSDPGNEFIEIYNPTESMVDLSFYFVKVGDSDKVYSFPVGSIIAPGEYRSFTDSQMKFTLVNSTSRISLAAVGDAMIDETDVYQSPKEGESWAMINDAWQFTNRPTPGAVNLDSLAEQTANDNEKEGLGACPAGKYRNPLTNRCRNIVSDSVILAACGPGKYRNPDTNRCRSLQTSTLAPCKAGQYRSPETNRCRNTTAASVLKPCKEGQQRSKDTNRCRKLTGDSIPSADFAVQPIKESGPSVFVGWLALGGVGMLVLGYGVWEWRREITAVIRKLTRR